MKRVVAVVVVGVVMGAGVVRAESIRRTVEVVGEAGAVVVPAKAVVIVGATARESSAAKAVRVCAARAGRLLEVMRKLLRCKDCISTAGYRLEPVFDYDKSTRTRTLKGYRAANYLRLELGASSPIGRVIDAAVAAGADEVRGPIWQSDPPEGLLRRLMAEAVANARARAHVLARAAGAKVGKAVKVRMLGRGHPPQRSYLLGASPTPVVAGARRLRIRVSCVFELY